MVRLILISAILALVIGIGVAQWTTRETESTVMSISLPDVSGDQRDLSEWTGRPLMVNFWATWCPPCLEEIPLLAAAQDTYGDQGLQIIGIALDDGDEVRRFGDEVGINYPSLLAPDSGLELMERFGNRGSLPFSVLVDRYGRVQTTKLGAYTETELEGALETLLQGPATDQ